MPEDTVGNYWDEVDLHTFTTGFVCDSFEHRGITIATVPFVTIKRLFSLCDSCAEKMFQNSERFKKKYPLMKLSSLRREGLND